MSNYSIPYYTGFLCLVLGASRYSTCSYPVASNLVSYRIEARPPSFNHLERHWKQLLSIAVIVWMLTLSSRAFDLRIKSQDAATSNPGSGRRHLGRLDFGSHMAKSLCRGFRKRNVRTSVLPAIPSLEPRVLRERVSEPSVRC